MQGVQGCQAVLQLLGIMPMGWKPSFCLLFPPQILDIISQRSGLNFLLPLVKNSHVNCTASITLAAGLPPGSDVLLQGNLILCLAEKPLQCDSSPQTALHSVSMFIFYIDVSQFNKMLFSSTVLMSLSQLYEWMFFHRCESFLQSLRFPRQATCGGSDA